MFSAYLFGQVGVSINMGTQEVFNSLWKREDRDTSVVYVRSLRTSLRHEVRSIF